MSVEKTLVLIKPDGVEKGLVGEIIARFEKTGLRIKALKMVWADEKLAEQHYPLDEEWSKNVFEKAKKAAAERKQKLKFQTHKEFGQDIQTKLKKYISEAPIMAIVLEGPSAIEIVRKMVGNTEPRQALPGTIRGDFTSIETYEVSDAAGRPLRNLIHASDSSSSAERETNIWFTEAELHDY